MKKTVKRNVTIDLRFINSFRFLASNLDKLSKNLQETSLEISRKFSMIKRSSICCVKGVFPYDHIDRLDTHEEKMLRTKKAFYSSLNDEDISDEDYTHAQTVWNEFEIKSLREYPELYNTSDVLIYLRTSETFAWAIMI